MSKVRLLAPLTIVFAVLFAYVGNLDGPFLFDDIGAIQENASLNSFATSLSPPRDTSVAGRPLANLSLALNHAIDGATPRGVRRGSLALHLVCALLILGVLRQGLRAPRIPRVLSSHAAPLAWGTALIWAVHPLGSECLYYATQRTEIVVAVCYLATTYAALRALAGEGRAWVVAAIAACALGMTAKAVMVTAPFVLFLFARAFDHGSFGATWRANRTLWIGLGATLIIQVALQWTTPRGASTGGLDPAYLLAQGRLVPGYFASVIVPGELVLDHGPLVPGAERWTLAGVALLLFVLAGIVGTFTHPRAAWPLVWCLGILAPSSSFISIATEVGADRRAYLAYVVALMLVLAIPFLWFIRSRNAVRDSVRRAWIVGIVVLALVASAWTRKRAEPWSSEVEFWTRAMEEAPRNPRAWKNHADLLRRGSRTDLALRAYRRAIALDPSFDGAHANIGMFLAEKGRAAEAVSHLERAVEARPNDFQRRRTLGLARFQSNDFAGAVDALQVALAARPDDAELIDFLGRALAGAERFEEAMPKLRTAMERGRRSSGTVRALASSLVALGDRAGALTLLERRLRSRPGDEAAKRLRNEIRNSR